MAGKCKRIAIYIEGNTREERIALIEELMEHCGPAINSLDGSKIWKGRTLAEQIERGNIPFVIRPKKR